MNIADLPPLTLPCGCVLTITQVSWARAAAVLDADVDPCTTHQRASGRSVLS